ncbi:hypothetical protein F0562_008782 [Nyssa sinensis]|uniref:VOC domain-containing protein n=1 Tax=Nyssa sinensis TaxID=561372 RepID=A0A5J5A9M2_9ASTE|nr:hypothetical protein F0562_008782 [Nyssa sinensis]
MTATAKAVPVDDALEWPQKDKRRFLHAAYRVSNLDRTIKFYTQCFGMQLLRKRDFPEEKYSNAVLGFGPEDSHFVVVLTHNHGGDKFDIGTGFGHFGIATQDIYEMVEVIRARGGVITREPGPIEGGQTALGMKLLLKYDNPQEKFSMAMVGYGELSQTTIIELKYNYGVAEYTKGNGYVEVAISTEDVCKSAETVELVIEELGGKITQPPCSIPGINTKITSFLDPDGWKTVLVDNEDFLKELQKKD